MPLASLSVLTEEWPCSNFKTSEGAAGLAAEMARNLLDDAGLVTQAEFMLLEPFNARSRSTPQTC